ncbi:PREDICTED: rhomboid-like protein 11, chloroplastic [Tarenaya hassleriana]|uniref:rhomboid-like protein 11, chloroplastic n=1 Tax=Tarenaya hassleriana TaxID=28532 RepID=UPI00053C4F25|nr:PREDICTED: rhomboid-like protein 11, chloroplastic [Tarenaya hassleriana]XP_010541650.1 PREDICTED: rhomboid-like protein 11, chloroplastic [Tarenaya hassleriana]
MSQLHLHHLSPPESSLGRCYSLRPLPSFRRRRVDVPPARPVSSCRLSRSVVPNSVFRGPAVARCRRTICRLSGSDITPQLELGKPEDRQKPQKRVSGIFWIILLNLGIYVADHLFQVRIIKSLYLYHNWPAWYQFVTATFCHANWNHLSSNLFFLYIFGKLVEEEEGNLGLWLSYLFTGVGANLVSWLVLPRNAVSIGASGAVFGLFAISVLVKMSWDWRKILEVLILGQFVVERVMEAAQASAGVSGTVYGGYSLQTVNHIAHLSGALVGVVLVWLLSRFPSEPTDQKVKKPHRR